MWQPSFDASNKRTRWLFCISGGVYLNLFIFLFQPYSKEVFAYNAPVYYQFVFGGIVTAIYTFTCIAIPHFFPRYFIAPYFTVLRFLLWYSVSGLLCHVPSFFYDNWLTHHENTWAWFVTYELQYAIPTFFFISMPFLIVLNFIFKEKQAVDQNTIEQRHEEQQSDVPPAIHEETTVTRDPKPSDLSDLSAEQATPQYKSLPDDAVLQLKNASGTTAVEIRREQLVYITSANNYVEIFYINDKQTLTRTLLRQTLTELEKQLVTTNGGFCRCHKAFIINKEKIISIKGNAKSYQLILKDVDKPIPVSRQKNVNLIEQYIHLLDA
jgi:DNA-binding LytR/AlgR family response regulator